MKGVRFPVQDLEKWELWCRISRVDFQDLATALMQKGFAELCGQPVDQLTTSQDFDEGDLSDDEGVTPSSSLIPEAGQPVDQAEEKLRSVMEFYSAKTGNKVLQRDRDAYFRGNDSCQGVAELPEHTIKYGVMDSVLKCRTRVNSFSYCLGAIVEAHEAKLGTEAFEYMAKTFAARVYQRAHPNMSLTEYFKQIHAAAQGQPTLPGAGGDLRELEKGRSKK